MIAGWGEERGRAEDKLTCDETGGGGREAVELLVMFGSLVHRDDPGVHTPWRERERERRDTERETYIIIRGLLVSD